MKYLKILLICFLISVDSFTQQYNFFTDSDNSVYYDPSWLFKTSPSELLITNSTKFPVAVNQFYAGVNSLKMQWTSRSGGDWGAAIASPGWIGWDVLVMDSISFWVYSDQLIAKFDLPKIYLEDVSNHKTEKINLSDYQDDIPASQWINIKVPLQIFKEHPLQADLKSIKTIFLGQSESDNVQHTMYIDELIITGDPSVFSNNLIVVLGSSTAAGVGANPQDSAWVNRFRHDLTLLNPDYIVFNLAVGGYSTYDVMPTGFIPPVGRPSPKTNNNITYALQFQPRMVVLNLPSNDAAYNYSIDETISNFDTIINLAEISGVDIFITTPQPRNFSNQSQLDLLFQLLDSCYSRYSSIYIDFWNGLAQPNGFILPQFNSGDGIHFNNAGHRVIYQRAADRLFPLIVSLRDETDFSKENFLLQQNYPNPFNPSTTIEFELNSSGWVSLIVYDILGREISTLINDDKIAGSYSVKFDTSGLALSSGIYFYQLRTAENIQIKKMIIMK